MWEFLTGLISGTVSGTGMGGGTIPVSYTHLDVYKRQAKGVENMWEWLEELLRYWGGKG